MLTTESIKTLKQTNVSADPELTKVRVRAALGAATREQKRQIDSLVGLKRISVNRVYVTGSISAKIALAIAQVLDLNPAWLTGEREDRGSFSAITANAFLVSKGYAPMVEPPAPPAKRKYTRRQKPEQIEAAVLETVPEEAPQLEEPEPLPEIDLSGLTEENAIQLLRSMFIRAEYSEDIKRKLNDAMSLLIH